MDGLSEQELDPVVLYGAHAWQRPPFWILILTVAVLGGAIAFAVFGGFSPIFAGLSVLSVVAFGALCWTLGATRRSNRVGAYLAAAAQTASEAILIADPEMTAVYANSAFRKLFAVPGGEGNVVGIGAIKAIVHGERSAEEFQRVAANAAVGIADRAELSVRSPAGRIEWRSISVAPIHRIPGYSHWIARDITARREVEAARRREERLVEDFLGRMPVGFFSSDAQGRFIYVNKTLADWLGIEEGEHPGDQGLVDFLAPDPDGIEHRDSGEHGEVLLNSLDGEGFRAYLRQSQLTGRDGEFIYSRSVVLRDFSDRGIVTRAMRELEQKFRSLFMDAPVGIVLADLSGEVADVNRTFLKYLGLHRDALIGKPLTNQVKKEDRSDLEAHLSKLVMGAVPAARFEARLPSSLGKELITSVYASRIDDSDGDVSGLLLYFIDTTDRKELEAQFTQAQRIQAVGQLAGGVAHDFNNLLTAMIGFCDMLLMRHGPGDPSFADIMQVKQNANRAANLVRQLLAFSRRQTLQPKVLNITDALSDMTNLLRRLIGENIELKMEHGRNLASVLVDPGQFDQVIVNLAVNARDAMPKGGVLTISTRNLNLEEPLKRGDEVIEVGDYALIEVSDTGTGIAKEDIESIFEPFFSTKGVGEGTGLGLSTVHGIVHQTGGRITVDSAVGEGTTFSIYLPRHVGNETKAEPDNGEKGKNDPGVDLTGNATVLLVEDEDAVRLFASRALSSKGYRVIEADNGEVALDAVNEHKESIDLIVSDVVMPGMDGHTMIRYARESLPDVKVILMSGYAEDAIPEEIGSDASIHFLHKPFSLKELAGKVKGVLES